MKVALVYDRVNKYGGAERMLEALGEIWPQAPLYTAVYDPEKAPWARRFKIIPSFLQNIPLAPSHHEFLAWATPLAFTAFDFSGYDVVISVTSAEAKNIITKPGTLHICYCLTPTRYLWSGYEHYLAQPGLGFSGRFATSVLKSFIGILRRWDLIASHRPDVYVAISLAVSDRIKNYYGYESPAVIYPPVDTDIFKITNSVSPGRTLIQPYLTVGRLVAYKRFDLVISAFNQLKWNLLVIGTGRDAARLKKLAGPTIKFIDHHLTDAELVNYYNQSRGFVFGGIEDFGIVAAEAQACGLPVICPRGSGMAEVVADKKSGVLFDRQDTASLISALRTCQKTNYDRADCRQQALNFSKTKFIKNFRNFVTREYCLYNHPKI
ncbi:hypothetical protein A2154_01570 [Candidatus Gottesmanbacteria bacterium RBG_16_43_7]|uniref:Glycosyl transferase family 1 domain-containing protein n=1 Tax=Candidatus Gottesmanbacteria bacterium RBG_16_43_7 TaxID=1798373 RepID=A0A1F5ZC67_9BACT|nr:MAG: hypothetical protein A2154_01570 [Candidatus Gottesmanbacteria bacterium RBG_16_43_7]